MRHLHAAALLVLFVLPTTARAQQPDGVALRTPEAGPQSAVQLGRLGLERFEQGAFAESFDLFARAEAIKHSPVFVLYMARAARHLGRLLESRSLLRRAAAEAVPDGAPATWQQARADAKGELSALEPRIPSIRVRIEGDPAGVAITADGKAMKPGASVERDPGSVTIRATRPTGDPFEKVVVLKEGDRDLEVVVAFGAASRPTSAPEEAGDGVGGTYVPGAIVLGAGGVGLILGSVFGLVAASQASDALESCTDGVCPSSQEGAVDDASVPANVATVAFIAGGALAATGVVLLIVLGGDDGAEAARSMRPSPARATTRIELRPTWVGASTSF